MSVKEYLGWSEIRTIDHAVRVTTSSGAAMILRGLPITATSPSRAAS